LNIRNSLLTILLPALVFLSTGALKANPEPEKVEANRVKEISLVLAKPYANPFMEVEVDAVVTRPDGKQLRVPAFWNGGIDWKFRYASS